MRSVANEAYSGADVTNAHHPQPSKTQNIIGDFCNILLEIELT